MTNNLSFPFPSNTLITSSHDGIFSSSSFGTLQLDEMRLRASVASDAPRDIFGEISKHHSISVMDREVQYFVAQVPLNGVIVDVGGGWGWHWRNLKRFRPDLKVIIVDFVRENLLRAIDLLGSEVGESIFLLHGDGTALPFSDNSIDGYWSVQTLQHVVDFQKAAEESHRVLKPNSVFVNYSLNYQPAISLLYKLLGKPYHIKGSIEGRYYLERASKNQKNILRNVFQSEVCSRFTEIIFKPELNMASSGTAGSILGRLDACLSSRFLGFKLIARQESFHCRRLPI